MTENVQERIRYNSPFNSTRGSDSMPSKQSTVTIQALIELLETKLSSDKVERDLLSALSDKTRKDKNNRFAIPDFVSVCTETLGYMKEQISLTYTQLHNLVSEKQEIEKNIQEAAKVEKHNDRLRIKVSGVRNLPVAPGEKVFIRISCDDIIFNTKLHEYLLTTFEEAFYEFFAKPGLEKLKVEVIIPSSMGQEEVLGDFQIPIKNGKLETEQDAWHTLTSRSDKGHSVSEVRLSLKLVSLRTNFMSYSTEEVERKISDQTQQVEILEKSLKNLTTVMSLLNEQKTPNARREKSPVVHQRAYSSTNTISRFKENDIFDDRLRDSVIQRSSQEKKKSLPPLTFQHLASQSVRGSEVKSLTSVQPKMRSISPGRETIVARDFSSTPRIEQSGDSQRNSLAQHQVNIFNKVKDQCVETKETRATSTQRDRIPTSSDWEADRNLESYRLGGVASKDQMSWKKENMRLNGMIRSLQEENKILLKEVQKLKDTEQKVKECKDKMSVLIGELNRVQELAREKSEEAVYWKQQHETSLGFDMKEVQGRIQKLVDENQRLRDIASKAHNESVYYKKQCELYSESKDKIDSLTKEIEILRTVNQNLNLEQLERSEYIEQLKRENICLQENNKTFSNELAKRDILLGKLKREGQVYKGDTNSRSHLKEGKSNGIENMNTTESRRNQFLQPLQPWNFLNSEKNY